MTVTRIPGLDTPPGVVGFLRCRDIYEYRERFDVRTPGGN
jgi:hypothetical protein